MRRNLLIGMLMLFASLGANAQFFGNGSELKNFVDFADGKFQFQSVKTIYWGQIVSEGARYVERAEKVWVPARLYLPKQTGKKVPAMVIMHGIGGLYTRDGKKRAYWDYAELLAENGIAAVIVDTHGARGLGVASQSSSTDVSLYTFVADAFAAADMLRSHASIDADRIGVMGFSKGGAAALLSTDRRFVSALSRTVSPFVLHIPIYPGCQVFPESPQPSKAPIRMLLGEKDNFTGTSGCFEIENKLVAAGVDAKAKVYPGAFHSWDEDFSPIRIEDKSSEDCRWTLRDGGAVFAAGKMLVTTADSQEYMRSCLKSAEIYAGRNDQANRAGRLEVVKVSTDIFGK